MAICHPRFIYSTHSVTRFSRDVSSLPQRKGVRGWVTSPNTNVPTLLEGPSVWWSGSAPLPESPNLNTSLIVHREHVTRCRHMNPHPNPLPMREREQMRTLVSTEAKAKWRDLRLPISSRNPQFPGKTINQPRIGRKYSLRIRRQSHNSRPPHSPGIGYPSRPSG